MKKRFFICICTFIFVCLFTISMLAKAGDNQVMASGQSSLTENEKAQIESWINKNMKAGKIPGASVVIINEDKTIYEKGFGYANTKIKSPVTPNTFFELGSNSKAFTALAILNLEREGRISLKDPVKKYIPWFQMKYSGKHRGENVDGYVDITLEQLLHHTSGIPFKSIGDIPVTSSDDALEKTVRTQVGNRLDFYPGDKFLYATINYDILGLVIKNVSGESYEQYMKRNVLEPLGLNNVYLFRDKIPGNDFATGYKVQFLRPKAYNAPTYRGNTPAGYLITNAKNLAKWIKIQMGTYDYQGFSKSLIDASHVPDRTVAPDSSGSSYASGWSVFQEGGGRISHAGNNPNFSTFILFRPQEKIGVGILTNINSAYTEVIANGINTILRGEKPRSNVKDVYISIDNVAFTIVLITIPIALTNIFLLFIFIRDIMKRKRKYIGDAKKIIIHTISFLVFLAGLVYSMYRIPDVLYWGLPWSFIKVWAPHSLLIAIYCLLAAVILFCIYFVLTSVFPKDNDKSIFIVATISIISGFGNAIIIFIINEALNRTDSFQSGLLLFFIMALAIYVYGQRLVRTRLLRLTNELVYSKRICLIDNILNASYEKIEQLKNGEIHAGLNNDTETISNFANIIITAVTSLVTLICCFVYLGIINFYGLLVSIFVILFAAGLYFLMGRHANRLWEETRDIQNVFFSFINSLINGFKELKIHNIKRNEFRNHMQESCEKYRDKRVQGDLGFANVFVIGELLFTFVIGVVAFVFPTLFKDIQTGSLRNYIFVFLYMTGPVHGVLDSIPQIVRIKISYKRLNGLIRELESTDTHDILTTESKNIGDKFELEMNNVEYSYKNDKGEIFKVGPVNYIFRSSEITFITGGNGSGKSTLAKLLSGLYKPDKGEITINKETTDSDELRQNYSTIFSDYHLFNRLYGINYKDKTDKINELLKILHIEDKLEINNGEFSTTKLSSGQRKRLALLVSYLEDRPIYLFDEWAADQDPEFRKYFYEYLLPDLKKRQKCIIAITHDDRYFDTADNVLKMEMGKVV